MTMPARPAMAGDLEPGWSRDEPTPYGPCYQRHVPGKGIIRVVGRDGQVYAWYLSARYPSEGLSWPRERFARPRDAMRDADQRTPLLAPRMFESLTFGETQELYQKLARAHDWGRHGPGETVLDEVRGELFRHMRVLEMDPPCHGPEPHRFIHAVREASRGAALQAMKASPKTGSWLSMTSHGKPQRLAAAASSGEAQRVMAPAGRASAPGLAGGSFPAPVQTGLSAAPPGPAPPDAAKPSGPEAASWVSASLAETVRTFEDTLRELAFRVPDSEAAARLDVAAGLLASGRILTEDASALLADTGPGSSELAELRAAGLAREVPSIEPAHLARDEPVSAETLDRYTRGLPPRNPAEQALISRLAAYDFSQAWQQARDDHLFPPPGTGSPGHSSCQPGTCPFDGPLPAGPAAAAAARNLTEQMREDHFAHGKARKEPGPHYEPAHQESTCPWHGPVLPPVERAARALAREHVIGGVTFPSARDAPAIAQERNQSDATALVAGQAFAGTPTASPAATSGRRPSATAAENFARRPAAGPHPGGGPGESAARSPYSAARRQPGQSTQRPRGLG